MRCAGSALTRRSCSKRSRRRSRSSADSATLAPDTAAAAKGFINSPDGTRLAYRAWPVQDARLTLAVVHGLGEHSGRYERFARGMAEFGFATWAVDLRGHGESAGQRAPEVVTAYRTDPLVHNKISSRVYAEWQHEAAETLARAGEIAMPFLILAGTADRLIDPEGSRRLHAAAPAKSELRMLDGRYHEPFNDQDSEEVFALIAKWLGK